MLLDRPTLLAALGRLDAQLAARDVRAELFLVGGAVMCLVYRARPSTKDVDGWLTEPQAVRVAARAVAGELGLPEDWLNDAAKGFVPPNAGYERWQAFFNLTVSTVDTETLLAMKCAAARTDEDAADIKTLAGVLGLGSSAEILAVVTRYFPEERLPVRSRPLPEEMFGDSP
jgi:predicted nucleotidyltransferase